MDSWARDSLALAPPSARLYRVSAYSEKTKHALEPAGGNNNIDS